MSSNVIGLTGYMRTGKDSVANMLGSYGYTRLAFADPLREMAYAIDPTICLAEGPNDGRGFSTYATLIDEIGYEAAKAIPDVRRFLQRLGTEGVRGVLGESTWVDLAKARALDITRDGGRVVFSDVRFPNEADAVREMGGEVWRTHREGYGGSGHASETALNAIVPDQHLNAASLQQLGELVQTKLGVPIDLVEIQEWVSA